MELLANDIESGRSFATDVCIIGAGAAGITLALELGRAGRDVVLLEGGGDQYDRFSQRLYAGREISDYIPPKSEYLISSRLRYLGGTTNHWNGWCRPLDPSDFERREWVPDSGWPIAYDELAPYYSAAAEWVGIPAEEDLDPRALPGPDSALSGPRSPFESALFRLSEPRRFRLAYREELSSSSRIRLILRANVTELQLGDSHGAVTSAVVRAHRKHRIDVRAHLYVIATGAIENARILLASQSQVEAGVGNAHDLVGRYFMEHLRVPTAMILNRSRRWLFVSGTWRRRGSYPELRSAFRLRPEIQARDRLLNSLIVFEEVRPETTAVARDIFDSRSAATGPEAKWIGLRATIVGEQSPSTESRVTLSGGRDSLGVLQSRLEWKPRDSDLESLRQVGLLLAHHLGTTDSGRARVATTLDEVKHAVSWSPHQMGTTRMNGDPTRGVVDTDCRVHGVENLFVAGSSVFPTAGVSNPTLSLLALTLRLSSHLQRLNR